MAKPTRASQTRAATARRAIGGEARLRLEADLTGLPADMEACWKREYVLGERDTANIQAALEDGWEPVTTAICPNANPPLLPGDKVDESGLVRRFGQVLMMRPRADGDAERQWQRRETEGQRKAALRLSETDTEAGPAKFDGENFREAKNAVSDSVQAGEALRAKEGRFQDA
jgi:hypothetical protein